MQTFSEDDVNVGARAVREAVTALGYGAFVTEDQCRKVSRAVLQAVHNARVANAASEKS
jgi:hypothetical protein